MDRAAAGETVTGPLYPGEARVRTRDRARVGVLGRRLAIVLLLVVPLVGGELAVRSLITAHRLPIAPAHDRGLEVSWANYERMGPTDILVLGDSLARMGIHPETLAGLAGEASGRPVTVFNLATPGAGFQVYRAFVEQLDRDGRLPDVVLIGVSTVALQRGNRPATRALRSPFGRFVTSCARVRGLEPTLSCHLASASALWRWRGQLGRLADAVIDPIPTTRQAEGIRLGADGFASGRSVSPGDFSDRLALALRNTPPIARAEPDTRAYVDLIAALRDRDVRVVTALIPDSPPLEEALNEREPGWSAIRSRLLNRLGKSASQSIIATRSIAGWWTFRHSHDARHFSPIGARQFTRHLWRDPEIRDAILEGLAPASTPGEG